MGAQCTGLLLYPLCFWISLPSWITFLLLLCGHIPVLEHRLLVAMALQGAHLAAQGFVPNTPQLSGPWSSVFLLKWDDMIFLPKGMKNTL